MIKRGNHAPTKVLVPWFGGDPKDANWEFLFDLQARYLDCTLGDKGVAEGKVLIRGIEEGRKSQGQGQGVTTRMGHGQATN